MGYGTTFHIYLPASEEKPVFDEMERQRPARAEGRILVIDDEESVRNTAGEILKHLGYQVQFAKDCVGGIKAYQEAMKNQRSFDAVIMDLTIPGGMGGKEGIRELRKIDPYAKVIVSSGYSDDPVMSQFRKYGFAGVVAKPYVIEELAEAIYQALKGIPE